MKDVVNHLTLVVMLVMSFSLAAVAQSATKTRSRSNRTRPATTIPAKSINRATITSCTQTLKQLGLAAIMFADDNDGNLPGKTSWKNDLNLHGKAACCGSLEYVYWGNSQTSAFSTPNPACVVIFSDAQPHDGNKINVCFMDGHVETLTGANPAQAIKNAGKTTPK